MHTLKEILEHNEHFIKNKLSRRINTDKHNPEEKLVIVSCMDTRLIELLPLAANIKNGDAKLIKVAGAVIDSPFDSVMKSIVVAVHALNGKGIIIIGHDDCGMASVNNPALIQEMIKNGIKKETFEQLENSGIEINNWISGFGSVEKSVNKSVNIVRNHPLIPESIPVSGLVINPETGQLRVVVNGYTTLEK